MSNEKPIWDLYDEKGKFEEVDFILNRRKKITNKNSIPKEIKTEEKKEEEKEYEDLFQKLKRLERLEGKKEIKKDVNKN